MKKMFTIISVVFIFSGCFSPTPKLEEKYPLDVIVSFYPHEFLADEIGNGFVNVVSVVHPGVEPHDFEPSPADVEKIGSSDLFIYHGSGFDPWAERVVDNLPTTQKVLRLSDGIKLISPPGVNESDDLKSENAGIDNTQDPHFWLDPILMISAAEEVKSKLIEIDSVHTENYKNNFTILANQLNALDNEFTSGLSHCTQNTIVTSHDAFNYLAKRYNFKVEAISGISSHDEPSVNDISRLIKTLKKNSIKYVLTESLVSQRFVQTVADEVGGTVLVLNPIEGLTREQASLRENYFTLMRNNLDTLRIALECK